MKFWGGFVLLFTGACAAVENDAAKQRETMLLEIEQNMRETAALTGHAQLDAEIRAVLLQVPRHQFVPTGLRSAAYENRPLPIGQGQTISQPYIVALMTQLLEPVASDRMLEVGTGSGYQAAVLARLVKQVYSIEIVPELAQSAAWRLRELGYTNVEVRAGDGYRGWPDAAPFDGIIVTAAPEHIPEPLLQQLKPGGRLVIPVGEQGLVQSLVLVEKADDGKLLSRSVLPVRFVPLTGERAVSPPAPSPPGSSAP